MPFGRRGRLVNEALDLIVALWSGESVTHGGEFFEVEEAGIGFSPARRPPIYVASAAIDPSGPFPSTVRDRLERFGDGWLPISVRPDAYAAGLERVRDLAGEGNRIDPAYYQDVVVADTEEEALARARAFYRGYYDEDGATYGGGGLSDDEIRERGAFGPPGRIRDHLDDYEAAGVETFVTRFVGSNQRDQLSRFAAVLSR